MPSSSAALSGCDPQTLTALSTVPGELSDVYHVALPHVCLPKAKFLHQGLEVLCILQGVVYIEASTPCTIKESPDVPLLSVGMQREGDNRTAMSCHYVAYAVQQWLMKVRIVNAICSYHEVKSYTLTLLMQKIHGSGAVDFSPVVRGYLQQLQVWMSQNGQQNLAKVVVRACIRYINLLGKGSLRTLTGSELVGFLQVTKQARKEKRWNADSSTQFDDAHLAEEVC